jgi:pimeloyl-ACP methyl ester carboxylesterase
MNEIVATRTPRPRPPAAVVAGFAAVCASAFLITACGDDDETSTSTQAVTTASETDPNAAELDRVVNVDGNRGLYVRCTGTGSPTVVMEGGDLDTADSYAFAEEAIAAETRACVYDRAGLGRSDPPPGPVGLDEVVGDFEALLDAASIRGPYVLVGTSGGGYIPVGYAAEHPDQVAGMVFVEVPAPFRNPPDEIVELTRPSHPENLERRDYLQVEKDAWAARKPIGDIPITVISNRYSKAEIAAAEFPSERRGMQENVEAQKGWLVLSPRAEQVVVDTGHAVEESDPQLVIDAILDVVKKAR